jgi:hypothetical protein
MHWNTILAIAHPLAFTRESAIERVMVRIRREELTMYAAI